MRNPLYLLQRGLTYLVLIVAAFLSIFPFFWMLVGATNTSADIIKGKADYRRRAVRQYRDVLRRRSTCRWCSGTRPTSPSSATFLTLLVSSLAGYGFEIFRSRFRERIFGGMLLMLSIPFAALMIPLFMMMGRFGLINTHHRHHPARHRLDLHHLLLPPGDEGLPARIARRGPHRRAEGMADLPVHLPAGDALDLCGGDDHRLHG